MPLEDHYAGDEAFEKYSESFCDYWESFEHKEELLAMVGGEIVIARPIAYHLVSNYKKWMLSTPPALEGLSPTDCLKTKKGRQRLKCCLLRFPC